VEICGVEADPDFIFAILLVLMHLPCFIMVEMLVVLFCSLQIDGARRKVTITLNDCLACSGCVTSAETVLITQQSQHELYRVLSDIKKAEVVLVTLPVGAVA